MLNSSADSIYHRLKTMGMIATTLLCGVTYVGFAQETTAPTHVAITATFSRKDATGKKLRLADPSLAAFSGEQAEISINDNGVVIHFAVRPTVGTDGMILLNMDTMVEPAGRESESPKNLGKESTGKKPDAPVFHSVLPADGLYSVESIAGVRRWVRVGHVIDGWTIRSYDRKREVITISRPDDVKEISLSKAANLGATSMRGSVSAVSVKSGESMKFTTPEGIEVEVKAWVMR